MVVVVKRDGRTEEYIPEKLIVSLLKNGVSVDDARRIEHEIRSVIEGRKRVSSLELAALALKKLGELGEEYRLSWIYYDINHKRRRTDLDVEKYLRGGG